MLPITWQNENFILYPEKAVFWESQKTLIITDPHFGKEESFRHAGIPIPWGSTESDLLRLEKLLQKTQATQLIILGDFFHNAHSLSESILKTLQNSREKISIPWTLIRGNHDKSSGDPPSFLDIECVTEPFQKSSFSFFHHPPKEQDFPAFAGHIHPSISLRDKIGMRLRCSCFFLSPNTALLPAFGSFTGTYTLKASRKDRVFVIGENEVIELKQFIS